LGLLKVMALPLVTLVLGFMFNTSLNKRQANESNMRLYTEMMGRREEADSNLRKDMFNSILKTFMSDDPKSKPDQRLREQVLNLELLAYNFHESLDIGPLFKDVRSRIPAQKKGPNAELRSRLERVAHEVIMRQLTVVSDSGMVEEGNTLPGKTNLFFGLHTVADPDFKPGEDVARLCLSMDSTDEVQQYHQFKLETTKVRHYRQFTLEIFEYDPLSREVQVRLYVSRVLNQEECQRADLDLVDNREIDTNFWVGLFDFPMIDNTRLTSGERCSVSLTVLTPSVLNVALAYFPGSRASLKDKPYYDEVMHDLVRDRQPSGPNER
ncbi:MAG: hypothetical protein ACRD2L_21850, partial [Terriglobia bacterium]